MIWASLELVVPCKDDLLLLSLDLQKREKESRGNIPHHRNVCKIILGLFRPPLPADPTENGTNELSEAAAGAKYWNQRVPRRVLLYRHHIESKTEVLVLCSLEDNKEQVYVYAVGPGSITDINEAAVAEMTEVWEMLQNVAGEIERLNEHDARDKIRYWKDRTVICSEQTPVAKTSRSSIKVSRRKKPLETSREPAGFFVIDFTIRLVNGVSEIFQRFGRLRWTSQLPARLDVQTEYMKETRAVLLEEIKDRQLGSRSIFESHSSLARLLATDDVDTWKVEIEKLKDNKMYVPPGTNTVHIAELRKTICTRLLRHLGRRGNTNAATDDGGDEDAASELLSDSEDCYLSQHDELSGYIPDDALGDTMEMTPTAMTPPPNFVTADLSDEELLAVQATMSEELKSQWTVTKEVKADILASLELPDLDPSELSGKIRSEHHWNNANSCQAT
jgi:hypothetical protein